MLTTDGGQYQRAGAAQKPTMNDPLTELQEGTVVIRYRLGKKNGKPL